MPDKVKPVISPDLIERVRNATGPDREIDWDVDEALTGEVPDFHGCPRYTASIDAALALVERVLPGWQIAMGTCGEDDIPWACLTEPDDDCRDFPASAPTIPLALIAALLSALNTPPVGLGKMGGEG